MEVYGQHNNREERVRQTRDWLNATPLDDLGRPLPNPDKDSEEPDMELVNLLLEQIRLSLASGVRVHLSEDHQPTLRTVLRLLSPEERALVSIDEQVAEKAY